MPGCTGNMCFSVQLLRFVIANCETQTLVTWSWTVFIMWCTFFPGREGCWAICIDTIWRLEWSTREKLLCANTLFSPKVINLQQMVCSSKSQMGQTRLNVGLLSSRLFWLHSWLQDSSLASLELLQLINICNFINVNCFSLFCRWVATRQRTRNCPRRILISCWTTRTSPRGRSSSGTRDSW